MSAFLAALIPLVPAVTALTWQYVHTRQHDRGKVKWEASQTADTEQGNVTVKPSVPPEQGQ